MTGADSILLAIIVVAFAFGFFVARVTHACHDEEGL